MNELQSWFYANSLILNTEKTTAISFHTRQRRDLVKPQIKFGNMDIAYKSETKFLGIHVSKYMKWYAHVMSLSSRLSKFCYMIKSHYGCKEPTCCKEYLFCISSCSFEVWFSFLGW
jgi:hypothetical protein